MNQVGPAELAEMISAVAGHVGDHREQLNRLDANLGDGDHGTSISTAFGLAVEQIAALDQPQPWEIWLATAKALMNGMGGASGALFGTFFLKGVGSVRGRHSLDNSDITAMLGAGLEGVKSRGKAQVGDKTMVDALDPAVEAYAAGDDFTSAWSAASEAAWAGAQSTTDMIARQGRAKYLGERGIGHQDAGATTIALMFEAIQDWWETAAQEFMEKGGND